MFSADSWEAGWAVGWVATGAKVGAAAGLPVKNGWSKGSFPKIEPAGCAAPPPPAELHRGELYDVNRKHARANQNKHRTQEQGNERAGRSQSCQTRSVEAAELGSRQVSGQARSGRGHAHLHTSGQNNQTGCAGAG